MADGIDISELGWGDAPPKAAPPPAAPKALGLWDAFKQNILAPTMHTLSVVGEGAVHALPDTVGFVGDAAYDAAQIAKSRWNNDPAPPKNLVIPGAGPIARGVDQSFNSAEDSYTHGQPPRPRNKAEEYANTLTRGAADMLVGGGPEGVIPRMVAGASSAGASKVTYDLTGNENLATAAGLVGLVAPEALRIGVKSAQTGRMLVSGASHPNFPALVDTVKDLEGGGTFQHPATSPKGAKGPMQVMDATAADPGHGIRPWNGKTEVDRARVGTQLLAALNHKYEGDTPKVLAAYNWGEGNVDRAIKAHGDNWIDHAPPETQSYVDRGLGRMKGSPVINGIEAPDGLPGNGSVPPISGEELAKIMGSGDLSPEEVEKILGPRPEDDIPADLPPQEAAPDNVVDFQGFKEEKELPKLANLLYQQHEDAMRIEDQVLNNESPITAGEAEEHLNQLEDMAKAFPDDHPLKDKINSLRDTWRNIDYNLKEDPTTTARPMDSSHEKFTPYVDEPPQAANDAGDGGGQEPPQEPPAGGGEEPPEPPKEPDPRYANLEPEDKIMKAVQEMRPLSSEQKRAFSAERANRAGQLSDIQAEGGGRDAYYRQLSALKGGLPRIDFESIAHNFTENDVKHLLDKVNFSNSLLPLEKVSAQTALMKLLGAEGAKVPTSSELRLLSNVFHPDFIHALMSNRPLSEKIWEGITNTLNLPRTLMASFDLSAPFRQGAFLVGRKEFWTSFFKMFQYFGSEKAFNGLMEEIKMRPTYDLMRRAGLQITNHGHFLEDREEAFMSNIADKIPVIGKGVKMSEQAYEGFLNKLRADTFDSFVKQYEDIGVNLRKDPAKLKDISSFINAATGRGSLGKFNQAAPFLSTIFFSPRLIASRLTLLNPLYYAKLDPVVRTEAIKSLLTFAGVTSTALGLAVAGGMKVEKDPRSSDWAKIRVNNTRFDPLAGFQQYIRLAAQLITNSTKDVNGKVSKLGGRYGSQTRLDVATRFVENKFSPVASFVADFLRGKDGAGNKFDLKNETVQRFIPLFAQDVKAAVKDMGDKGWIAAVPSALGVGVQTYQPKPTKAKKTDTDLQQPQLVNSGKAGGTNLGDVKW